jgi:hypothetical protein
MLVDEPDRPKFGPPVAEQPARSAATAVAAISRLVVLWGTARMTCPAVLVRVQDLLTSMVTKTFPARRRGAGSG